MAVLFYNSLDVTNHCFFSAAVVLFYIQAFPSLICKIFFNISNYSPATLGIGRLFYTYLIFPFEVQFSYMDPVSHICAVKNVCVHI